MSEPNKNVSKNLVESSKQFSKDIYAFFYNLIDLKEGLDRKGTIQNIKNNKRMKGANAWLLMCSIMIASLGLDLNSPAVIIGAMLISPLMSPILGVGLGVGINDKETLYISLQHFVIAIFIALFTSTFYFFFTPFGEATGEIIARTSPNTLDALVAFFGGVAGIISGSRIDKSNAIPGVAIATALMPPLCVTGFGIATGNWKIIANSFYLFFLNATLVAFATFLIVRFLGFPMKQYESVRERKRMLIIIYSTSLIILMPSIYILTGVYKEFKIRQNTEIFIKEYCKDNFKYVDTWQYIKRDSTNQIAIKVYGSGYKYFNKQEMEARLPDYNIYNTTVDLIPTSEVDLDKLREIEADIRNVKGIAEQLEIAKNTKSQDSERINELQAAIDSLHADTVHFSSVSRGIKAAFPDVERVAFAEAKESDFKQIRDIPFLFLSWKKGTPLSTRRREEPRIAEFVKTTVTLDTIIIVNY